MKASIFVLGLVLTAGTAMANQGRVVGFEPLSAVPTASTRASNSVVFSAMNGSFVGFAAASGPLGYDDYDSTLAGGNAYLQSMRFVGGVAAAGGSLNVQFFDTLGNLFNQFTVGPLGAGYGTYNITLETALNAKDSTFLIPEAGYMQINAVGAATGRWFLATDLPTVGTESRATGEGSLTTHSHRFELTIPAPGAMALLGMGGLLAARRRR